jgi:hypothetical protein
MAIDRKYGHVTLERGTIGHDEPVFVLRAQDRLAVPLLQTYMHMCGQGGSPEAHLAMIEGDIRKFGRWQRDHHTQIPASTGAEASD